MLAAVLSSFVLSLLVSSAVAQSYVSTWGFCFQSSSLPNSPYGPWSVALYGTLSVTVPYYYDIAGTPASAGGQRWAQNVTAASVQRMQLNRDGSTSTATLQLATVGVQGSDMVFFNSTPYTDWNGMSFAVISSSDKPFSGSSNWVVYPNDFPVQAVELYYDLPAYNYPTEYHADNQTNAVMTIQPNTAPTCTPAPLTSTQCAALTYQFCYQAYASASGSQPAWQTAIQGTFYTSAATTTSTISGQSGLYILYVTGTRTQQVSGNTTSVNVVGQAWHNSGGGDGNEFGDDPLLLNASPFLVPNRGFVLYTSTRFAYPNGTLSDVDYYYSQVNADPLSIGTSGSVIESLGPIPTWSAMAISCSCTPMTCGLITDSSNAATGSSTASTTCSAQSLSFSPGSCATGTYASNGAGTCALTSGNTTQPTISSSSSSSSTGGGGGGGNGAARISLSLAAMIIALASAVAMVL